MSAFGLLVVQTWLLLHVTDTFGYGFRIRKWFDDRANARLEEEMRRAGAIG